ncbi:hypothetical protein ZIOFF_025361 [Zingiber officinale]|uniref:Uncharacterized protein n=1 Tax=Zingiber officinale TaxID=94328 RepID=A0A8J5HE47_ZINOF|nr:hypothetical protein ZIOFF_025361 [Zingiber officinale]
MVNSDLPVSSSTQLANSRVSEAAIECPKCVDEHQVKMPSRPTIERIYKKSATTQQGHHNTGSDKETVVSSYMTPKLLRPKTIPTPKMCPTTPQAKVSAKVNPAGSPDCRPESRTSNRSPAVAFLFADGASPNLPANNIKVVHVTII